MEDRFAWRNSEKIQRKSSEKVIQYTAVIYMTITAQKEERDSALTAQEDWSSLNVGKKYSA